MRATRRRPGSGSGRPWTVGAHNLALRAGAGDVARLEDALAEALIPVIEEAADEAARNFERLALDHSGLTSSLTAVVYAETLAEIRRVAERHQPDGGYGETFWDPGARKVFWVCGDWTEEEDVDEAKADFLAIDGVDEFEHEHEGYPTSWRWIYPSESLTAAGPSLPGYCLAAELRGKTDPVRIEAVKSAMTPALKRAGLSFDVTNPFAAKALARSASHVVGISQTTQLDVMKVVGRAYEEGLTIPQTAKAIRAAIKGSSAARARMIARTELAAAASGGSLAATQIVADATDTTLYKTWLTAPGAIYPRHEDYEGLDGQTVGLDEAFDVGGETVMYPGDPDGVPEETINCFPAGTLVVAPGVRTAYRRWYEGDLVRVETDRHHELAGTPNHPVLTSAGWKPLGEVEEGDYLVCGDLRELESAPGSRPDVEHAPALIEEVVGAFAGRAETRRIPGRSVDFHGDGMETEIEVVAADGLLRDRVETARFEPRPEAVLVGARLRERPRATDRPSLDRLLSVPPAPDRVVGSLREATSAVGSLAGHPDPVGLGSAARLNPEIEETTADRSGRAAVEAGQGHLGDAFDVSLTKVVQVERETFGGHVFNLQTRSGAYLAGGIIAHNCRCTLVYTDDPGELTAAAAPASPIEAYERAFRSQRIVCPNGHSGVSLVCGDGSCAACGEPMSPEESADKRADELDRIYQSMTAAATATWTPPAPDEILRADCEVPGAHAAPPMRAANDTISVGSAPFVTAATRERIQKLELDVWPPRPDAVSRHVLGTAKDTVELYSRGGAWDADRAFLHDQIIAAHFVDKIVPAEGDRTAYLTAGGGASGKSSAVFGTREGETTLAELETRKDTIYVDPDRIKKMLPEFKEIAREGSGYAASAVHEESSQLAKDVVRVAIERGYSVVLDTTGSTGGFAGKIAQFKTAGYDTRVSMVSIRTNEAIARSVARGDRSGRYVQITPLKDAHRGASANLADWSESDLVDGWRLYDNSTSPELVAEGGRGKIEVYDEARWQEILAKATE